MAITHFQITELPDPNLVTSKIGTSDIVLNTNYPIANQNQLNFVRTAVMQSLSLFTFFKWKTYDEVNDIYSNEARGGLQWFEQDNTIEPDSTDVTENIINDDVVIGIDLFPVNPSVDDIEIENIEGIQNWTLNNSKIYIGQIIQPKDLFNLEFKANSEGGGIPYSVLNYKVSNRSSKQNTVYTRTVQLNIPILSELIESKAPFTQNFTDEFDNNGTLENYNVIEQILELDIKKGYVNSVANINVVINSPFLALNQWNKVIIDDGNGNEIEKYANETFNFSVDLNTLGQNKITITNVIVEDASNSNQGQIDVTLVDINGDTNLVSNTDTYQLITNL